LKNKICPALLILLLFIVLTAGAAPVFAVAVDDGTPPPGSSSVPDNDNDLSKAVEGQNRDALKNEVGRIGGSIVSAVRALFITFFAIAVIFIGLQTAGGGLKDPRKIEMIKGGGISAVISAVLVYKAEAIVAFVFDLIGVDISSILK
jgi:hypothetical protein